MHSKGKHKQDEKTTLRMGENICKWSNWQRINLQNLQAAHAAQYQNKANNPIQTWAEDLNRHFFVYQRRYTGCQQTHERMLIIRAMQIKALEKCKSKLQWGITSHQSDWLSSKNLQTINAGEGV